MINERRNRWAIGAVLALGSLALFQHWLAPRRPVQADLRAAVNLVVTSSVDRGPGSLREAIFAADTTQGRARIVLRTDHISLRTPLPPLVNPLGVVMEADHGPAEIDSREMSLGPVLDVMAPNSVISGVKITNSPNQGILVRAEGTHVLNVTISGSDEAIHTIEGIETLLVERTTFENNRIGVQLSSSGPGIILRNNRFLRNRDAAVWAVRGAAPSRAELSGFSLKDSFFESDRMSLVLGNTPALIEGNDFAQSREVSIFLIGAGAVVRGNHVRNSLGIGVFADGTANTVIEDNEIDHNRTIGVLVRASQADIVSRNRFYENGYGIAFVLGHSHDASIASGNTLLSNLYDGIIVIGDSPVIRDNQIRRNSLAALRILDFVPQAGPRTNSSPFIGENFIDQNRFNTAVHGEYRAELSDRRR